ncbi:MAG: DUF11 domain-containing protein [Saprospiraceae bacterium]|nr:DUF11 domain-containing protein [Saprospiraceae bacterium]
MGQYDLTDLPGFDNDITINSASFTSNAPGNGGNALAWTLANDQAIAANGTHTYTLVVNVSMNLNGGGGDDQYTSCGEGTTVPQPGQGLYNFTSIDTNNDGTPDDDDDACGDLPALELEKTFVSATSNGNGTYNVVYNITVENTGGQGQYDLTDTPVYDPDVVINSASYTSNAPGNGGSPLAGNGPWTLANNQPIAAQTTHTYTLTVVVDLNRTDGIGNEVYDKCEYVNDEPQEGEGLFNRTSVDANNDGTPEDEADDCGDLPLIDLELDKSISNSMPNVGQNIVFTIVVTNQGPAPATGVIVTDQIPSGYDYVSHSGGTYNPATGEWNIGNLGVGQSTTLLITAQVNAAGVYVNLAEVTFANEEDVDSTPDNGVDTDNDGDVSDDDGDEDDGDGVEVEPNPVIDLELDKSISNTTPNVGTNVTFTIVVVNQGPSDATGVQVTDQLPSGYTYVSHSGGAYNPATGLWNIGNLAIGQSVTLNIVATVLATGNYVNLAEVTFANEDDIDSTPDNGVDTDNDGDVSDDDGDEDDGDGVEVAPNPIIDLELEKSVNNATPAIGENITFTVEVTNQGPSIATGVIVTDQLPSGYTYVSHSGGAYNAANGQWNIGTLGVNQTVTLQITVSVNAAGVYLNLAEVTNANEDDIDSTPDNGVDTDGDMDYTDDDGDEDDGDGELVTPSAVVDLELEKSVSATSVTVGQQVVFTVTVTNQGPSDATGVQVTDQLPSGYNYVSHSGGFYSNGQWVIGFLPAGASATIQITATVNATGDYLNLAEVTACNEDDIDSTPGNGVDTDNDGNVIDDNGDEDDGDGAEVIPNPIIDLELDKSVNKFLVIEGEEVIFTVSVVNHGPSTATGVQVTDQLPSGYNYVSHSGGTYNPATGLWDIGTLAAGQSTTLIITATVNEDGDHLNLAEITARNEDELDSTPANGVDTDNDDNVIDDEDDEDDGDGAEVQIQCNITAVVNNIICNDNGTATAADDTYTFVVTVTGTGESNSWKANDPNSTSGVYGVPTVFGPYLVANGNLNFFIEDNVTQGCRDFVQINAPQECSIPCDVVVTYSNVQCNDNGTPSDPSDDTFTFDITVDNPNGSTWSAYANGVLVIDGLNYNRTEQLGPFPISAGNVTVLVEDNEDNDCFETFAVLPPNTCSDECNIDVTLQGDPVCNNNGTPGNPNDDTFTFTVVVSGMNNSSGWTASNGASGAYNVPVVFGPYAIANGPVSITFADNLAPVCSEVLNVTPPATCSDQCVITVTQIGQPLCNNNNTPFNPNDDTFTFTVNISGANAGAGWTATVGGTIVGTGTLSCYPRRRTAAHWQRPTSDDRGNG